MNCTACPHCFSGRCAAVCSEYRAQLNEFRRDIVHERFVEIMAPFAEAVA